MQKGKEEEQKVLDLRLELFWLANSRDPRFMKLMRERVERIKAHPSYDEALSEVLAAFWIHQPPSSWVRDVLIPDDFVLSKAKKILPY